jgi:hypothetical protein
MKLLNSFHLKGNCLRDTLYEDPHNSFNIYWNKKCFEQKLWRAVSCPPLLIATSLVAFDN